MMLGLAGVQSWDVQHHKVDIQNVLFFKNTYSNCDTRTEVKKKKKKKKLTTTKKKKTQAIKHQVVLKVRTT